jgi:hypothetical protein
VQRHTGFDVVAGETDAAVSYTMAKNDSTGPRQDARYSIVADSVGRATYRMGNLSGYRHHHQVAEIHSG